MSISLLHLAKLTFRSISKSLQPAFLVLFPIFLLSLHINATAVFNQKHFIWLFRGENTMVLCKVQTRTKPSF